MPVTAPLVQVTDIFIYSRCGAFGGCEHIDQKAHDVFPPTSPFAACSIATLGLIFTTFARPAQVRTGQLQFLKRQADEPTFANEEKVQNSPVQVSKPAGQASEQDLSISQDSGVSSPMTSDILFPIDSPTENTSTNDTSRDVSATASSTFSGVAPKETGPAGQEGAEDGDGADVEDVSNGAADQQSIAAEQCARALIASITNNDQGSESDGAGRGNSRAERGGRGNGHAGPERQPLAEGFAEDRNNGRGSTRNNSNQRHRIQDLIGQLLAEGTWFM